MAHKKGVGSSRNGRDQQSAVPRRQEVRRRAGARRQHPGAAAGHQVPPGQERPDGDDDTLFALVDGVVKFEHKDKERKKVSVYPVEAQATA